MSIDFKYISSLVVMEQESVGRKAGKRDVRIATNMLEYAINVAEQATIPRKENIANAKIIIIIKNIDIDLSSIITYNETKKKIICFSVSF